MAGIRCITTRLQTVDGRGWLLTICDRAPRRGERGTWLHTRDLGEMLREHLTPVLNEEGCIRPRYVGAGGIPRLGVLYTYAPGPRRRVQRGSCLVAVEVQVENS